MNDYWIVILHDRIHGDEPVKRDGKPLRFASAADAWVWVDEYAVEGEEGDYEVRRQVERRTGGQGNG